jgi:hypothetical protein
MGRPRKKLVEENLDFEARVDEEIKNKESEIKTSDNVLKREGKTARQNSKLRQKELRDKFRKGNIEIQVMCNLTNCNYIYIDNKSGNIYRFERFGQVDFMPFDDLYTMSRFSRKHLEKYWIIITEVLDDELTIEDLIQVLGIQDVYSNEEMMYDDNLDYILKETDLSEFENIIANVNENYKKAIENRAIGLYNAKKFNDISRLRVLIGDEDKLADILEI